MDHFPHLYGHEKLKKMWEKLYESGKMPHTMILYGEEGLGKTTAALELSGLLTGMEEQIWDFWETTKPDEAEKESVFVFANRCVWYLKPLNMELKIEQFRQFLEEMPSFDERPHVCIIDEAQTMKDPIANSLLKTLEEPVGNLYFILIAHDITALLPTIISRSERFPFFALSESEYKRLLREHKGKYKLASDIDEEMAYQLSEGNPGVTLDLCTQEKSGQLDKAMQFWETLTHSSTPFSELQEGKMSDKKKFLQGLRWIILIGRDLMVLGETGKTDLIQCLAMAGREKKIAPFWKDGRTEAALCFLEEAKKAVTLSINVNIVWDAVLIHLEHIRKDDSAWNRL